MVIVYTVQRIIEYKPRLIIIYYVFAGAVSIQGWRLFEGGVSIKKTAKTSWLLLYCCRCPLARPCTLSPADFHRIAWLFTWAQEMVNGCGLLVKLSAILGRHLLHSYLQIRGVYSRGGLHSHSVYSRGGVYSRKYIRYFAEGKFSAKM